MVNNNALDYFGGVTTTVTPDNCKVAVIKNKDWIDPVKNKDFQAWAEHNDTVITPAKIKSQRWNPVAEGHVKILSVHILTDMEDMTFYLFEKEEKEALLPLPDSKFEYLESETVKVAQDFSFTFDKVHYTMPRKYLRQELEIRTGEKEIYVYNKNGDLIRTHQRNYTPKLWVVIPSDMPAEYGDYRYWSVPYFQHKASRIGPNTQTFILGVVKKFNHLVQSFRSCFGIIKLADRYSPQALENCCRDAVILGKFSYTYIANTIASYHTDVPCKSISPLKKTKTELPTNGAYKDDDSGYTLSNLIKRQEEEGF